MIGHMLLAGSDFDFLYGTTIPFKAVALRVLYHTPGVIVVVLGGITVFVIFSEIARRISQKLVDSKYFHLVWILPVAYVFAKTRFTSTVAEKTGWAKILRPKQFAAGDPRLKEARPGMSEQDLANQMTPGHSYGARH